MNMILWILLIVTAWAGTRWFYLRKLAACLTAMEAQVKQVNDREKHLVAAINHFYNNTIAVYIGSIALLAEELQTIPGVAPSSLEKLQFITRAGHRLANYVQSFSRPDQRQKLIDEYLKL